MESHPVHACRACGYAWSLSGPAYCPICDGVDVVIVDATDVAVRRPTPPKLRLVGFSPIPENTHS